MLPARSRYCDQFIWFLKMKPRHLSSSSCTLTEIITNDFSLAYLLCISRSDGTDATQGGHQVPQKSSKTTLPRKSSSATYSPSDVVIEKSGAYASLALRGLSIIFEAVPASEPSGCSWMYFFSSAIPSASRDSRNSVTPRL